MMHPNRPNTCPYRPCFRRFCRYFTAAALVLSAWTHAARAETVVFTSPLNGWRNSAGSVERYTQEVRYPAVAVNTPEGQSAIE